MSTLGWLIRQYRPWLGWAALTVTLLALTWAAGIGLLALSGWFIVACALAGAGRLAGLDIFTPSAAIRAAALLRTLARYGERLAGHALVLRVLASLRARSFAAIAALPLSEQRRLRSADLLARLTADIDALEAAPLKLLAPLTAAALSAAAAVALASWLAPAAAALLLAGLALSALLLSLAAAAAGREAGARLVRARTLQRQYVLDHIHALAELCVYRREPDSRRRLRRIDRIQRRRRCGQERIASLGEHGVQALVGLSAVAILGLALVWHGEGRLAAPLVALLALLTLGLGEVLASLPGACWSWGEIRAAAGRVAALESGARAPVPSAAPREPTPLRRVELIALQPGIDGRPLCAAITERLEPGRPLVVHGPSGAGKSTLLETVLGERPALTGTVLLDGQPLQSLTEAERYRRIGLLPQQPLLLDASVAELLTLGLPEPMDPARLWAALDEVGLAEPIASSGQGLALRVGEFGLRLSGGQARRLALAALRLRDPGLVLLDEPFAGLDGDSEARLLRALSPWLAKRCVLIASHKPERLPAEWPRLRIDPLPRASKEPQP